MTATARVRKIKPATPVSAIEDTEVAPTEAAPVAVVVPTPAPKTPRKKATKKEAPVTTAPAVEAEPVAAAPVAEPTAEAIGEPTATAPEGEGETTEEPEHEHQGNGSAHCVLCGRTLTVPASIERGLGPLCATRVKAFLGVKTFGTKTVKEDGSEVLSEGFVPDEKVLEAVEAVKATFSDTIEPADFNADENEHPLFPDEGAMKWVKLAEVHVALAKEGRSISDFIKAFGGNRNLKASEARAWYWKPVYVGRTRYLPAVVLEHLDDISLVKPRAAKAAPAPAAETETAPSTDEAETAAEAEDTGDES